MEEQYEVQGVKVNYYCICKRKLWLFSKGIALENTSDRVLQGQVLHEHSYQREKNKEVLIDNLLRLDMIDKDYVKEIKISSSMEEADKMQLYYYLYYLKNRGISKKGKINYTKEKRVEEVELTTDIEKQLDDILQGIYTIEHLSMPPSVGNFKYCDKCAYYAFCYVKED